MNWTVLISWARNGVLLGLVMLMSVTAPFAVAQDVHHELAAADTDGHEHSDTDICQWVQHHTAGALDLTAPVLSRWELVAIHAVPALSVLLSTDFSPLGPSRAPPRI